MNMDYMEKIKITKKREYNFIAKDTIVKHSYHMATLAAVGVL